VKRILSAAILGCAAAAALAQADGGTPARPKRGSADAGVRRQKPILLGTDPPGRLRPNDPAPDAGAARTDPAREELRREIQQLRARLDALERERGQSQETAQQLQQITSELQQLRQQSADAEARRQEAADQQQARASSVESAVNGLYAAQSALATGSYGIDAQLSQAETAFTGQARRDVQAARVAVQNHDLQAARAYLAAAISEAQRGR
jgi:hypothetical protein